MPVNNAFVYKKPFYKEPTFVEGQKFHGAFTTKDKIPKEHFIFKYFSCNNYLIDRLTLKLAEPTES